MLSSLSSIKSRQSAVCSWQIDISYSIIPASKGLFICDLRKEWWGFHFVILLELGRRKPWWLLTDSNNGQGGTRWCQFSFFLTFYERMASLSLVENALFEYTVLLLLAEWISLMVISTRKEKRRPLPAWAWGNRNYFACDGVYKGNSDICCIRTGVWWKQQNGTLEEYVPQSGRCFWCLLYLQVFLFLPLLFQI